MFLVTSGSSRPFGRRQLLGATTALAGAAVAGAARPGRAGAAHRARWQGLSGTSGVTLRWLGNNGWEIAAGPTTILIDPWLTRFPTGTYHGGTRPDTPLRVDRPLIDRHITRADLILLSHGHFDHITDVPYIAAQTAATVLGTESHHTLLRAMGAPAGQLSTVSGGEYIQFDGFTIQVFRSLHSMVGTRRQVPFPGTRPGPAVRRPRTVKDLVEGGTLIYQITIDERFSIITIGTPNFVEHELTGLRPDLALLPGGGQTVHDYLPRLLRTLDHPPLILPTHWDDFDVPLEQPAVDPGPFLPGFAAAVATLSPDSRFVPLDHLTTFTP
jgi:L-ascorbate metabolism protein UlaG (beta-lactamase superfamily)